MARPRTAINNRGVVLVQDSIMNTDSLDFGVSLRPLGYNYADAESRLEQPKVIVRSGLQRHDSQR